MSLNRTSLTAFAASMRDPDPKASHEACRKAFHEDDVLCVRLDDATQKKIGWANMEMLKVIGRTLYGKGQRK
jgi:hypothetical protein